MAALRRVATAALALILFAATSLPAQELGVVQSQILVLDLERLFEESLLGQRMISDHKTEREAMAARNRKLEAELEAEEQRLTGLRAETSPVKFRELADAFDAKVQKIRRDSERRVLDLERDRERLPIAFLRQVEPVLTQVMRDVGGMVVLDARTVLFRAEAVDMTDTAIVRIDKVIGTDGPGETPTDPPQPEATGAE